MVNYRSLTQWESRPGTGAGFGLCRARTAPTQPQCLGYLADFFSIASAADSFLSRWGSNRGAPVCSSQASPMAAPQVVQSTDSVSFSVSSLVFTFRIMPHLPNRKCSILLSLSKYWATGGLTPVREFYGRVVQKCTALVIHILGECSGMRLSPRESICHCQLNP
jgi:hypothetical protein